MTFIIGTTRWNVSKRERENCVKFPEISTIMKYGLDEIMFDSCIRDFENLYITNSDVLVDETYYKRLTKLLKKERDIKYMLYILLKLDDKYYRFKELYNTKNIKLTKEDFNIITKIATKDNIIMLLNDILNKEIIIEDSEPKKLNILSDFGEFSKMTLQELEKVDLVIIYNITEGNSLRNDNFNDKRFYESFIDKVHDVNVSIDHVDGGLILTLLGVFLKNKYLDAAKYLINHKNFEYTAINIEILRLAIYDESLNEDSKVLEYLRSFIIDSYDKLLQIVVNNPEDLLKYKFYKHTSADILYGNYRKISEMLRDKPNIRLHFYDLLECEF